MIRTGNVALHYYTEQESEPTLEDFEDFLSDLPENVANYFQKQVYEKSKGAFPLRRHAAERNYKVWMLIPKHALKAQNCIIQKLQGSTFNHLACSKFYKHPGKIQSSLKDICQDAFSCLVLSE